MTMINLTKKIFLLALSASLIAVSCSKNDKIEKNGKEGTKVLCSASLPTSTKINMVDPGSGIKTYWSSNDSIGIITTYPRAEYTVFHTTGNDGNSTTASFSGTITKATSGDMLYAHYPASLEVDWSGPFLGIDCSSQDGTLSYVQNKSLLTALHQYTGSTNFSFNFTPKTSVLRLKLTFPTDVNIRSISISAPGFASTAKYEVTEVWASTTVGDMTATFTTPIPITAGNTFTAYMVAIPQSVDFMTITATTTDSKKYIANITNTANIIAGKVHTIAKSLVPDLVGQYYFSDGTWGTLADNPSKTPIGIIFQSGTSAKDQAAGFTHGYALALRNAASGQKWKTTTTGIDNKDQSTLLNTPALMLKDLDGYTHCHNYTLTGTNKNGTLDYNSTNYPVLWAATHYGEESYGGIINKAPTGTTNSGWYLPSEGQWYQIIKNLGAITSTYTTNDNDAIWKNQSTVCKNAINTYITNAKSQNSSITDDDLLSTLSYEWFWSSSESHEYGVCFINLDYFTTTDIKLGHYVVKTYSIGHTRSVIAF